MTTRGCVHALSSLLASAGLDVAVFASATEFLEADKPDAPACLVLDLELPDIHGLELQKELAEREAPPIVFITGHGDIPSSVKAMKAGAVEFLSKPFGDEELLRAIDIVGRRTVAGPHGRGVGRRPQHLHGDRTDRRCRCVRRGHSGEPRIRRRLVDLAHPTRRVEQPGRLDRADAAAREDAG